jgi:hypothetical protein
LALRHRDGVIGRRHETLRSRQTAGVIRGNVVAGVGQRHEAFGLRVEHTDDAANRFGRRIVAQLDQAAHCRIVADDVLAIGRKSGREQPLRGRLAGRSADRHRAVFQKRGEFGRSFTTQLPAGGVVWIPYVFSATGERILKDPTVLEIASVHATNYGAGLRFNLIPPSDQMPGAYGFVEVSRRYTNEPILNGDRIFTGLLMQY